ncbi:Usp17le, partial [Symbiodinium necroappetens]
MGEALAEKLAKGASELRFLLTQHKVADDIQGELYENGVADLKKMLKDSFSIDPTESLKLRTQAAGMVVAWKTAISRVERQAEAEATHEVRDIAKPILSSDYISMRQAFSAKFGELEDKHIPAKEFIEKKQVDPDTLLPHWDAKGTLSLKK